jgi:CBS domain-containing protein
MTVTPKRVRADSPVTEALAMMREFSIDEIPVIDDAGCLVGLIDVQDLIAHGFSGLDGE